MGNDHRKDGRTDGIICGIFAAPARPPSLCSCICADWPTAAPWKRNEMGENWRFHPLSANAGRTTAAAAAMAVYDGWMGGMADVCYFPLFIFPPPPAIPSPLPIPPPIAIASSQGNHSCSLSLSLPPLYRILHYRADGVDGPQEMERN